MSGPCDGAIRASGKTLTDEEVTAIADRVAEARDRLMAAGHLPDLAPRLLAVAREEGQKARLAAAQQRRQAALSAIKRARAEELIRNHRQAGLSPRKAVLALLEGTARGVAGGRKSVAAMMEAFEARHVGDMLATLQRRQPAMMKAMMLTDEAYQADIVREMFELRAGGTPGSTGNADARITAEIFAAFGERSRQDLNRLGAAIGKLDGWAGPQVHDPQRVMAVTEDDWIKAILPRLDLERTFGRDGVALDGVETAYRQAKADADRAAQSVRLLRQGMADTAVQRAATLARRETLQQRRALVAARLEERQGERAATVDRYSDNLEREQDGRILLSLDGRDSAAERHSLRRREAARENAHAETRLRRKTETSYQSLQKFDAALTDVEARLKDLEARDTDAAARLATEEARMEEAHTRRRELDVQRDSLRPSVDDPQEFLRHAYRSIVTGMDGTPTAAQRGETTGPASLARSLQKHRVLHFKTPDDWLAYNRDFGHGTIFSAMIAHQQRAARLAGQMEVLGPNPEAMMQRLLDDLRTEIRNDPDLDTAAKTSAASSLSLTKTDGTIRSAFAEVRGLTLSPGNLTAAQIGSGIRAVQTLSKLGGTVISSVTDLVTSVANLRFHGKPLGDAWGRQIRELVARGRGDAEQREIAYLLGQGFDGMIGHIITPYVAGDGAPGWMTRAMERMFRWSGQTWWTDAMRAGAARMLSAHVGSLTGRGWVDLPQAFRHGLSLHGITEAEWTVIRQGQWRSHAGDVYVTPDRIRDLGDDVIRSLIPAADIVAARAGFRLDETTLQQFGRPVPVPPQQQAMRQARYDGWLARRTEDARLDLELALRRYFSDETSFAVLETDVQARRILLRGTHSGTVVGEALRFFAQFKGFPLAFGNRVLGRALRGGEGGSFAGVGHLGHLLGGLLVAGYAAMTAKDTLRGWSPRPIGDPKTLLAAMMQGGALGLYGDFLFGQATRFGNGPLETLAGPGLSTASSVVQLAMRARDGDAKAGDALNIALQNTPYINLWYARPALNYLVINSLYEAARPGYLQRQERARRKEMGQHRLWDPAWVPQ